MYISGRHLDHRKVAWSTLKELPIIEALKSKQKQTKSKNWKWYYWKTYNIKSVKTKIQVQKWSATYTIRNPLVLRPIWILTLNRNHQIVACFLKIVSNFKFTKNYFFKPNTFVKWLKVLIQVIFCQKHSFLSQFTKYHDRLFNELSTSSVQENYTYTVQAKYGGNIPS